VREQDRKSAVVESAVVERLKRRSDFRAAAGGVRSSGRAFVVQARQWAGDGAIRVGFTVSRQVGNAVERNRVRRRLREIVRLSAAAGAAHLRSGHDYVLTGRRAALAAPFGEMMRELDRALVRIHTGDAKATTAKTTTAKSTTADSIDAEAMNAEATNARATNAKAASAKTAHNGTGGVRRDRLHEAGSPSPPRRNRSSKPQPRRNVRKSAE
jgi:ribonuclease P protein component